jgi:hypothetical protein
MTIMRQIRFALLAIASVFSTLVGTSDQAPAAVVLTFQNGASFVEGSGVQSMNILAQSNANDLPTSIVADIAIQGATFTAMPGTFGLPGFIGEGNLDMLGSTFIRDMNNPRIAYPSLEFINPQLVPSSPQPLARFSFDISGLAPGFYSLTFSGVSASDGLVPASGINGGFQITAVPEPSSVLLMGSSLGLCFARRRRSLSSNA